VSSKGDGGRGAHSFHLLRRARDGAGSHKKQSMLQAPGTRAGTKVDVLLNGIEAFDASDDCTMLSSDNEQASQANGREAGPADAPLLLVKYERTETVANASDASDDDMMRNSDHEQAPRADGREAGPAYAPFRLAKDEPKEHVADASDASDDCIMLCSDHEQASPADGREAGPLLLAQHEPTDKVADASDASDDCIFHSNHNKTAPPIQIPQHALLWVDAGTVHVNNVSADEGHAVGAGSSEARVPALDIPMIVETMLYQPCWSDTNLVDIFATLALGHSLRATQSIFS